MQDDARHEAVIRKLLDRQSEDRDAREKRRRRYRQHPGTDPAATSDESDAGVPRRIARFRTKVPCRATPEGRRLLDELGARFPGSTVSLRHVDGGRQALMLTGTAGTRQIGWVEHCVQTDPERCNVRDQGLAVETDGGTMLVLRFRYPRTAVRMSSGYEAGEGGPVSPPQGGWGQGLPGEGGRHVVSVDFSEIRPAVEPRPSDAASPPRQVWLTRPETETLEELGSRDYDAFYLRLKLEVQTGVWHALLASLAEGPGARWHRGSYYTLVREPDEMNGRIHQRTLDDHGDAVDIGLDRVYDASAATDILLLYLEADILADFADIYFTLQGLGGSLNEDLFSTIRDFWADTGSLAWRDATEQPAVLRMCQRVVPTPAQAPLLARDWTILRQSLVDRYGEGGRHAADLAGRDAGRPREAWAWPLATFPAGEVGVGLRFVYRQEWRHLGVQRGAVVGTVPPAPVRAEPASTSVVRRAGSGRRPEGGAGVRNASGRDGGTRDLDAVVAEAVQAATEALGWPLEVEGSINTGARGLAAWTELGLERECHRSVSDTSSRLTGLMRGMAYKCNRVAHGYGRFRSRCEVMTRLVGIQNVVLVAEELPAPSEIDLRWVRRHRWILEKALLDESCRDALSSIDRAAPALSAGATDLDGGCGEVVEQLDIFRGTRTILGDRIDVTGEWTREYGDPTREEREQRRRDREGEAKRERLYEHLRGNILHYQRAIWQREDPQQRCLRYRKSGMKVPLEWRFEPVSAGAETIDQLRDRLAGAHVDGQFAAYDGGRQADLDQVIDPAGPVGYYGNLAVYQMRPEFGSGDLFSMLHFFKSPCLRPSRETGRSEVADPAEIRIAQDPAVMAASDRTIYGHRQEMASCVPELRLELARARKEARGTDADALDLLERRALRRHYPAYLFRRERARRLTVVTDTPVVDAAAAPDALLHGVGAAEERRWILDGCGGRLVGGNGPRRPGAAWSIAGTGGAGRPGLFAGGGAARPPAHPEPGPVVLAGGGGLRRPTLLPGGRAGPAHGPEAGGVVVTAIEGDGRPGLIAGIGSTRDHGLEARRAVLADGDGKRWRRLRVGPGIRRPGGPEPGRLIPARDAERLRPIPVAGRTLRS